MTTEPKKVELTKMPDPVELPKPKEVPKVKVPELEEMPRMGSIEKISQYLTAKEEYSYTVLWTLNNGKKGEIGGLDHLSAQSIYNEVLKSSLTKTVKINSEKTSKSKFKNVKELEKYQDGHPSYKLTDDDLELLCKNEDKHMQKWRKTCPPGHTF